MSIRIAGEKRTGPAKCRYCGERIVWAISDHNRRVAVNAQVSFDTDAQVVLWNMGDDDDDPQLVSTVALMELRFDLQPWPGQRWTLHPAAGKCVGTSPTTSPQLSLLNGGRS